MPGFLWAAFFFPKESGKGFNVIIFGMINLERLRPFKTRFVFGGASAIITIMGLIVGLSYSPNAKTNIIASIFVMGVADNVSDSLGIHIFQEA